MSASSYIPLSSKVLATIDGTIFCPHDDSSWNFVNRRIFSVAVIAGTFGLAYYWIWYPTNSSSPSSKPVNKNVGFHVSVVQKNDNAEREIRETSSSSNAGDTTLRSVASLSSDVSTQLSDASTQNSEASTQNSEASTQHSDASTQSSDDSPPSTSVFKNGPIGSVDEKPPKNGSINKSIQCGGNCSV
uniref:Uncharacterized protein n=1 Tax=Panagrolaimus sp. PS1159 TaxID=55785 RepID=A0AC35GS84_9BILA